MIDAGLNEAQFDDMRNVYGIQLAHEDKCHECAILQARAACFEKLYYGRKAELLQIYRDWDSPEVAQRHRFLHAVQRRSGTLGRGYYSDPSFV